MLFFYISSLALLEWKKVYFEVTRAYLGGGGAGGITVKCS